MNANSPVRKRSVSKWMMIAAAVAGLIILVALSGCADTFVGGIACPHPINCVAATGTIDYPPFVNNMYNMMYKETGRDRSGNGYIRYSVIGKRDCRLNRRIEIYVNGLKGRTLSCDFGNIEEYVPLRTEVKSTIVLRWVGPDGDLLKQKVIDIIPDVEMIPDYLGTEFGWKIVVTADYRIDVIGAHRYWIQHRYR